MQGLRALGRKAQAIRRVLGAAVDAKGISGTLYDVPPLCALLGTRAPHRWLQRVAKGQENTAYEEKKACQTKLRSPSTP